MPRSYFERYCRFCRKNFWFLLLWLLLAFVYSYVHEIIHCAAGFLQGYSCTINMFQIPAIAHTVINVATAVSPYVLDISLLLVFSIALYLSKTRKLFYFSLIPSLDLFTNLAIIPFCIWLKQLNDFTVIAAAGFYWAVILIAISAYVLTMVNYYVWLKKR